MQPGVRNLNRQGPAFKSRPDRIETVLPEHNVSIPKCLYWRASEFEILSEMRAGS